MTKLLLVSFNLVILFTYKLFFGGDVSVNQDFPTEVNAGETFIVEVEIKKGDREGFAKWQQKLPQGFIAKSNSTRGATFSFKNQEVKLIWMSLPKEESFKIKYEVSTSSELEGTYRVAGKFSFIEENERRDIAVEEQVVTVTKKDPMITEEIEPETVDTSLVTGNQENNKLMIDDVSNDELADSDIEPTKETEITTPENIDEQNVVDDKETTEASNTEEVVLSKENLQIERKITHINNGNYEVTLTINKGNLNSFGKVEEHLPPNYEASAITLKQGIFSFENKTMKILWMTLPKDETIKVTYALKSNEEELKEGVIHGVFSYLNGDESHQIKMEGTSFTNYYISEQQVVNVENTEPELNASTDLALETEMELSEEPPSKVDIPTKEKKEELLVEEITNIPSPETGISYKVQIAAARKEVTQAYFTERHGIKEPVAIEFHNSWYKYTIGGFPIYKEARDKRNQVWAEENKINDAFVTAYNSGERISVQEALMISKQKWYK